MQYGSEEISLQLKDDTRVLIHKEPSRTVQPGEFRKKLRAHFKDVFLTTWQEMLNTWPDDELVPFVNAYKSAETLKSLQAEARRREAAAEAETAAEARAAAATSTATRTA